MYVYTANYVFQLTCFFANETYNYKSCVFHLNAIFTAIWLIFRYSRLINTNSKTTESILLIKTMKPEGYTLWVLNNTIEIQPLYFLTNAVNMMNNEIDDILSHGTSHGAKKENTLSDNKSFQRVIITR